MTQEGSTLPSDKSRKSHKTSRSGLWKSDRASLVQLNTSPPIILSLPRLLTDERRLHNANYKHLNCVLETRHDTRDAATNTSPVSRNDDEMMLMFSVNTLYSSYATANSRIFPPSFPGKLAARLPGGQTGPERAGGKLAVWRFLPLAPELG